MKSLLAKLRQKDILILCVIVIFGAYLRLLPVLDLSFPYTYDVGRDLLELSQIVNHFSLPLIGPTTGLPGLFYGPWWYYMLVPAFFLGGGNPQAVVLFMVATGLVAIIVGYIVGKILKNSFLGLILALFFAVSPAIISLTTQIWNPNVAPLFLVLLLLTLVLLIRKKTHGNKLTYNRDTFTLLVLLGVFCGLSIDSEVVYGLLLTGSLIVYLAVFVFRNQLRAYLFTALGLLIIFLPRIFFELRHNFIMTRTILVNLQSGDSLPEHAGIVTQFISALTSLKSVWDYTFGLQSSMLGWGFFIIALVVVIKFFKRFSYVAQQILLFIFVTLAVYLIGLTFFSGAIWGHYTVGLPVIFILLLSLAISTVSLRGYIKYGVYGFLLIFILFQIRPDSLIAYYTKPHAVGDVSIYRNQVEVVDYIYDQSNGQKFSTLVYTPPVRDYTYQYLFEWFSKSKQGFESDLKKTSQVFVIIEPDTGYEDRLKNWLNEKKNIGKIINKKTFPSGITVQTRSL